MSKPSSRRVSMLLLCTLLPYGGFTLEQSREAPKSPSYLNGSQCCLPTAYAADLAKIVPDSKACPPGSTIYQLTMTVWVRRAP
jgi:hypothetical protein